MSLKDLHKQQQEQLQCLLSYVTPRLSEFVEPSSLTWHLIQEGLLIKDSHYTQLGTTQIKLSNVRLSLSGQEWVASHTKPTIIIQFGDVIVKFIWHIIIGLITVCGSFLVWWVTAQK